MARILVIDDDPQILKLYGKYLHREGHTIETASTGREGIRLLQESHYDVVITDIIMPDGDGFEVVMSLRKVLNRPKIIAVSGGSSRLNHEALLKTAEVMSVDLILTKPIDFEQLVQSVRALSPGA